MALMSGKRRFDEKVMQNCQFHGHLPCMPCLHRASTMHAVVYPMQMQRDLSLTWLWTKHGHEITQKNQACDSLQHWLKKCTCEFEPCRALCEKPSAQTVVIHVH